MEDDDWLLDGLSINTQDFERQNAREYTNLLWRDCVLEEMLAGSQAYVCAAIVYSLARNQHTLFLDLTMPQRPVTSPNTSRYGPDIAKICSYHFYKQLRYVFALDGGALNPAHAFSPLYRDLWALAVFMQAGAYPPLNWIARLRVLLRRQDRPVEADVRDPIRLYGSEVSRVLLSINRMRETVPRKLQDSVYACQQELDWIELLTRRADSVAYHHWDGRIRGPLPWLQNGIDETLKSSAVATVSPPRRTRLQGQPTRRIEREDG